MARRHDTTVADLVYARADLAGLRDAVQIAKHTGLPERRLQRRLSDGGWTLAELQALDRVLHFEAEDLKVLMGGRQV